MIFVAIRLEMNVQTAIQGIAITVGNAKLCLNKAAHNPNQNICIRYIHNSTLTFQLPTVEQKEP